MKGRKGKYIDCFRKHIFLRVFRTRPQVGISTTELLKLYQIRTVLWRPRVIVSCLIIIGPKKALRAACSKFASHECGWKKKQNLIEYAMKAMTLLKYFRIPLVVELANNISHDN